LELELDVELMSGVRIIGRCDKIESRRGIPHILDLKTGSVTADDLKIPGLERTFFGPRKGYALQLLVYAWAYLMQNPTVEIVRAGIVPIQKASESEGLMLMIGKDADISRAMLPELSSLLRTLVSEILDPDMTLAHDPESKYCSICATP
jgi:hypothetical protein